MTPACLASAALITENVSSKTYVQVFGLRQSDYGLEHSTEHVSHLPQIPELEAL